MAVQHLWNRKLNTGMRAFGVTLIVILTVIPAATSQAAIETPQNYFKNTGTDVWMLSKGALDYYSNSLLSDADLEKAQALPGVSRAEGALFLFTTVKQGNKEQSITVQSYDPTAHFGGPWKLSSGRNIAANGETVIDDVLASDLGIRLNQRIRVGNGEFIVVGMSSGTSSIGKQFVFVSNLDARERVMNVPIYTHVQIKAEDPEFVVHELRDMGYSAYTRDEFVARNRTYLELQVKPTLDALTSIGVLFGGVLLILLTVLQVQQSLRTLAGYKSRGVSVTKLSCVEILKVGISSGLGFGLSLLLSPLVLGFQNAGTPGLTATLSLNLYAQALTLVLIAVAITAVVIVFKIRRIDPARLIKEV